MELSIIVPVYNMAGEGKLEYGINSLLAQTAGDFEIIAVDDASTDDSLAVLERIREKYPDKLKVAALSRNRHQGGARNEGIRRAQGKFIGFMDSDDWVACDMFEKLLACAKRTGADVVGCDYSLVSDHTMEIGQAVAVNTKEQTGELTEEKKRRLLLNPGSMVVKIYRKEIITDNELWFPEDIFYEDNCMSPLWMLHCKHFERVPEPLYYYYQHEVSTVHHISLEKCRDRMRAMELLIEKSRKYGFYDIYRPELEFKYAELYLVNTLFSCLQSRTKGRRRLVRQLKEGIQKQFPDFRENVYYRDRIGAEEQKLIGLLMKSEALFFAYYDALAFYRKIKAGR